VIAARFGTTVDAIKAANGLSSDVINVGQRLTIP
jgi:LysM repeat protein